MNIARTRQLPNGEIDEGGRQSMRRTTPLGKIGALEYGEDSSNAKGGSDVSGKGFCVLCLM